MRIYIVRLGAFGDQLIITPALRKLKEQGHHLIVEYSDRGKAVLENNPHVDEHIFYKSDSVPVQQLNKYWEDQAKKFKADRTINFTETIEYALALHPRSPRYNYTKEERRLLCNKNYYEETMKWAKLEWKDSKELRPELFFTEDEMALAKSHLRKSKFNVLICFTGSSKHKAYPWIEAIIGEMLRNKDTHIITTGDLQCKIMEEDHPQMTCLSGEADIRTSMALTGLVDLVISPDTGILHASGCYDTPKIGLLGHTTVENITKHFINDLSVEADPNLAECAPCFRLIYDMKTQCPIDIHTGGAFCMSKGIPPEKIAKKIEMVYDCWRREAQPT